MYEVIMNYENCVKYFSLYSFYHEGRNEEIFRIKANNDEIIEYLSNLKTLQYHENDENIYFHLFDIFDSEEKTILEKISFNKKEKLVFKFDKEEIAFYFKLKFC